MGNKPEPPPARGSSRAQTVDFNGNTPSLKQGNLNPMARKLIVPPYNPNGSGLDGARENSNNLHRTISNTSTHSLPNQPIRHLPPPSSSPTPSQSSSLSQQINRKAAPPIPTKKPTLQSNSVVSSSTPSPPPQKYREEPNSRPEPPPPRRSMAPSLGRKQTLNLIDGDRPPLPPRTGTGMSTSSRGSTGGRAGPNLLDDEPNEELEALKGWEVLKPTQ